MNAENCGPTHHAGCACHEARRDAELARARAFMNAVGELLEQNGCDCDCDHHPDEHDDDCERCLACLIQAALDAAKEGA